MLRFSNTYSNQRTRGFRGLVKFLKWKIKKWRQGYKPQFLLCHETSEAQEVFTLWAISLWIYLRYLQGTKSLTHWPNLGTNQLSSLFSLLKKPAFICRHVVNIHHSCVSRTNWTVLVWIHSLFSGHQKVWKTGHCHHKLICRQTVADGLQVCTLTNYSECQEELQEALSSYSNLKWPQIHWVQMMKVK